LRIIGDSRLKRYYLRIKAILSRICFHGKTIFSSTTSPPLHRREGAGSRYGSHAGVPHPGPHRPFIATRALARATGPAKLLLARLESTKTGSMMTGAP